MELNLKGKRAVVTGGASGLCYTVAKAFYDAGADVLLAKRPRNQWLRRWPRTDTAWGV